MCSVNKSGLEIATDNELSVLRNLHKYGWLRSKDIACLCWQKHDRRFSNSEPDIQRPVLTISGLRMAQITLKRLKTKKQILSLQAPDNSIIYALSQRGVNRLNTLGINSVSGKDLIRQYSFEQYRHRVISNEISISGELQGFKTFTERQIAQNHWHGEAKGLLGKKPDCLISNRDYCWWIEVERSKKNQKDYQALIDWLCDLHEDCKRPHEKPAFSKNLLLQKVIFICSDLFEKKLIADLIKKGWHEDSIHLRLYFSKSLYSFRQSYFL